MAQELVWKAGLYDCLRRVALDFCGVKHNTMFQATTGPHALASCMFGGNPEKNPTIVPVQLMVEQ